MAIATALWDLASVLLPLMSMLYTKSGQSLTLQRRLKR